MLNKVMLIGHLGKDPEVRAVGQSGVTLCEFSLACTEKYKDKNGNQLERTEWVNVNAWRDLGEIVAKYCAKGSKVYVEGRLETQSWDDRETGQKRYRTLVVADKVIFLTPKGSNGAPPAQRTGGGAGHTAPSAEDDLPF